MVFIKFIASTDHHRDIYGGIQPISSALRSFLRSATTVTKPSCLIDD